MKTFTFWLLWWIVAGGQLPMAGAILLGIGVGNLIRWRASKFRFVMSFALDRAAAAADYYIKACKGHITATVAIMAAMATTFASLSPATHISVLRGIHIGLFPKFFTAYLK